MVYSHNMPLSFHFNKTVSIFLIHWTVSIFFNRMVSFGVEDFEERYGGLKPSQFADMIALTGDRSDNIPGYFVLLHFKCYLLKHEK